MQNPLFEGEASCPTLPYTHTHTPWPLRTQSFEGQGLKVLCWGRGLRSISLGQAVCLSVQESVIVLDLWGQSERGENLYKTYMCGFYTEPFSGSKNTTKDSPVRLSIQSYWNGGAHICSGSLMLGTWPRSHRCVIITLLFDWMTLRGNRKVVAVHLFHSLLGWVCYILYRLVPESQPSLDTVSVLVWM